MKRVKRFIMLLFLIVVFLSCDNSNNSNQQNQYDVKTPIHSIALDDGGEVSYYLTEDGFLVTSMTSKSEELLEKLQRMSCIEICQEYGNNIIPEAIQKAYEKQENLVFEQENDDTMNVTTKKYHVGKKIFGPFPNWTFYTFQAQALKFYPYDNDPINWNWGEKRHSNYITTYLNHKSIGFFYTALYVKRGIVYHKLRERNGISQSELYSRRVNKGYFSIISCYRTVLAFHKKSTYNVFYNAKINPDNDGPTTFHTLELY